MHKFFIHFLFFIYFNSFVSELCDIIYHRRRGIFLYDWEKAFCLSRVVTSNKTRSYICLAHNSTTVMVFTRICESWDWNLRRYRAWERRNYIILTWIIYRGKNSGYRHGRNAVYGVQCKPGKPDSTRVQLNAIVFFFFLVSRILHSSSHKSNVKMSN